MSVSPDTFFYTQTASDGTVGRVKNPPRLVARAASTANVADLTACSTTMDGLTLVAGNLVLLKNQSTTSQNGYYLAGVVAGSTVPLTRVWPLEDDQEIPNGTEFFIQSGSTNGGTSWVVSNAGDITVGTTGLTFSQLADDLTLTATGAFTAAASVDAALAELYQNELSIQKTVLFSLFDFREVTSGGDVANAAGNGGLLASDTTPILRADTAEVQEISWAATNADIIGVQKSLPADVDGTANVTLELWVYTDNTGGGGIDAATFTVETSWDGGALVSDTATDSSPATSVHKITATIAAADIPDTPSFITVYLTPAAHANDPTQLVAMRLSYKGRLLTS